MGGQDGAFGIGDREAELTGAILRARRQRHQQEQECGVDQGGRGRDRAQTDFSEIGGGCLRDILQRSRAKDVGQERHNTAREEPGVLDEQTAGMPTARGGDGGHCFL